MNQKGKDIQAVKSAVRARDGFCCTQCGMSNEEHKAHYGKSLHVHRLIPGSPYSVTPSCVTLCQVCHGPKPRRSSDVPDQGLPFERVCFQAPSGFKAEISEALRKRGLSLSAYIRQAVLLLIETDKKSQ